MSWRPCAGPWAKAAPETCAAPKWTTLFSPGQPGANPATRRKLRCCWKKRSAPPRPHSAISRNCRSAASWSVGAVRRTASTARMPAPGTCKPCSPIWPRAPAPPPWSARAASAPSSAPVLKIAVWCWRKPRGSPACMLAAARPRSNCGPPKPIWPAPRTPAHNWTNSFSRSSVRRGRPIGSATSPTSSARPMPNCWRSSVLGPKPRGRSPAPLWKPPAPPPPWRRRPRPMPPGLPPTPTKRCRRCGCKNPTYAPAWNAIA